MQVEQEEEEEEADSVDKEGETQGDKDKKGPAKGEARENEAQPGADSGNLTQKEGRATGTSAELPCTRLAYSVIAPIKLLSGPNACDIVS